MRLVIAQLIRTIDAELFSLVAAMKTVRPIADEAVITMLKSAMRYAPLPCVRKRAHAILLSSKGYSLSHVRGC